MKNKTIILIIALAVLSIGVYGIYSFLNQEKDNGNGNLTYVNTKHDYNFQYSPSWNLMGTPQDDMVMLYNTENPPGDGGVPLGITINIMALENYDDLSLGDWVEEISQAGMPEELISEESVVISGISALKRTISPTFAELNEGPPISVYFSKEDYIFMINYLGRKPDYSNEMKNFENLLESLKFEKGKIILDNNDARSLVQDYMKYTLGMIPEAKINYEAAKKLLTPDLAKQFNDPAFIPMSYCIQDGPTEVKITSETQDKKMNWTNIIVEAKYGNEWLEMWNFQVVPVEGGGLLINKIECL